MPDIPMSDSSGGDEPQGPSSTKPYMIRAMYEWCV